MPEATLLGDLRERADGSFGGWCWAPERPTERLVVDLLVNDTPAASIVAAAFRRDLLTRGIGDGRHGFTLRLPANYAEARGEYFLTARERRSGIVFGRLLRTAPGGAPADGGAPVDRLAACVEDLWGRLAEARAWHGTDLPSARFREACSGLAARLATRAGHGLPQAPPIVLADIAAPALTVVLAVHDAAAALRQIAALAPAAALAGAEVLAVDSGTDPRSALLPGRVRNLRYLHDRQADTDASALNVAAAEARGTRLLLLDAETPSAAALLALARVAERLPQGLLLGPDAAAAVARVGEPPPVAAALPARLGLALCINRALWQPLDPTLRDGGALEYADLAFRLCLLGVPAHAVTEPLPADRTATPPAMDLRQVRRAMAAFADRWG
jgi:hypothetical protein